MQVYRRQRRAFFNPHVPRATVHSAGCCGPPTGLSITRMLCPPRQTAFINDRKSLDGSRRATDRLGHAAR